MGVNSMNSRTSRILDINDLRKGGGGIRASDVPRAALRVGKGELDHILVIDIFM
jgi:hypothetical protein